MMIKSTIYQSAICGLFAAICLNGFAQGSSTGSFTYQGVLRDANGPVNGLFDFQFSLWPDATSTNNQVDTTMSVSSLAVTNGLFRTLLSFPMAYTSFDGNDRFLEIAVRPSGIGTNFQTLSPRQQVTAAPYAIRANKAMTAETSLGLFGSLSAGQISGAIAVENGGTGTTNAANARDNLGLGTLATNSPSGTADATTFLRGDNKWVKQTNHIYYSFKANRGSSSTAPFIRYYHLEGQNSSADSTEANALYRMPVSGTLRNLSVTTDAIGSTARTYTVRKGTSLASMAATAVSLSVPGNFSSGSTIASVAVNAGDYISVEDNYFNANVQPNVNYYFNLTLDY